MLELRVSFSRNVLLMVLYFSIGQKAWNGSKSGEYSGILQILPAVSVLFFHKSNRSAIHMDVESVTNQTTHNQYTNRTNLTIKSNLEYRYCHISIYTVL
jgi:hypothetical protein